MSSLRRYASVVRADEWPSRSRSTISGSDLARYSASAASGPAAASVPVTQPVRMDQREPRLETYPDPLGGAGEHALPRGERAPVGAHGQQAAATAGRDQP